MVTSMNCPKVWTICKVWVAGVTLLPPKVMYFTFISKSFRTLAFGLGSTSIPPLTPLQNYSSLASEACKQNDTWKKITWKGTLHLTRRTCLYLENSLYFQKSKTFRKNVPDIKNHWKPTINMPKWCCSWRKYSDFFLFLLAVTSINGYPKWSVGHRHFEFLAEAITPRGVHLSISARRTELQKSWISTISINKFE